MVWSLLRATMIGPEKKKRSEEEGEEGEEEEGGIGYNTELHRIAPNCTELQAAINQRRLTSAGHQK